MKTFDALTEYAKDKVETIQLPPALYVKAQRRKNLIDSGLTLVITSVLIYVSLAQSSTQVHLQPLAIREYVQSEIVASRDLP